MPSGAPCPALRPAEAHTMRCAQMVARQPLANHARSPLAFLPLAPPSPFRLNNADREEKRWRTIEMEDDMDNQR